MFVLIILFIVMFFLVVLMGLKQKQLKKELEEASLRSTKATDTANNELIKSTESLTKIAEKQTADFEALKEQYQGLEIYCENIEKDIQGNYATSERFLIKKFYELLDNPKYQDITVYHSLGYIDKNNYLKEIDFLVVTKKGILIIESKHWKGVTYIYCDKGNDKIVNNVGDIFKDTQYAQYAKNSIRVDQEDCFMRVFVVRENDAKGTLIIRDYNNPVSQVRGYSWGVSQALGKPVANAVVFHKDEQCQVVFNNEVMSNHYQIDKFTSIVGDDLLGNYLDSLGGDLTSEEMEQLSALVEQKFTYHYKMDKSNYTEQKFKVFAGDIYGH